MLFRSPWLIEMLIFREGDEKNYLEPSTVSMGWAPYTTYVIVLTLLHHILLIFLEWIQFGSFGYFLGKVLGTTLISLVLVIIAELLFFREQRFRTNVS